ncbi:MAG TPA: DUF4388 domain-containing protein [bacterium]|nr:DUF4388 domain-containing protein [bacterium]
MGVANFTPLFRISGFGPLGLPTDPGAYGNSVQIAALNSPPSSASAYAEAGSGGLRTITGSSSVRLAAASDGSGVRSISGTGGASNPAFVLRFLEGQSKERQVPLPASGEFLIGHLEGLDLVLPKDNTSRRHARLSILNGRVFVEDLGSAGGTCINGKRIGQKTELKEDDRLLIGSTILKLERKIDPAPGHKEESGRTTAPPASPRPDSQRRMTGQIEDVPLPDLLQLLSGTRKSGVLEIQSVQGTGRVHLRDGRVYFCAIEGSPDSHPRKAIFRLLRWTEGAFDLLPPVKDAVPAERELNDSIDSILMNGMCEMDEINRLDLGGLKPGSKIAADLSGDRRLRDLSPEELDVMQSVLRHPGPLENFLDLFPGTDLQALTGLVGLVKKGFVVAR